MVCIFYIFDATEKKTLEMWLPEFFWVEDGKHLAKQLELESRSRGKGRARRVPKNTELRWAVFKNPCDIPLNWLVYRDFVRANHKSKSFNKPMKLGRISSPPQKKQTNPKINWALLRLRWEICCCFAAFCGHPSVNPVCFKVCELWIRENKLFNENTTLTKH